jgi:hypothetical protein
MSDKRRNGKLKLPLPFEEAIKAALKVEPSARVKKGRKARVASRPKPKPKS